MHAHVTNMESSCARSGNLDDRWTLTLRTLLWSFLSTCFFLFLGTEVTLAWWHRTVALPFHNQNTTKNWMVLQMCIYLIWFAKNFEQPVLTRAHGSTWKLSGDVAGISIYVPVVPYIDADESNFWHSCFSFILFVNGSKEFTKLELNWSCFHDHDGDVLTTWCLLSPIFLPASVLSRSRMLSSLSWKCWMAVCVWSASSVGVWRGLRSGKPGCTEIRVINLPLLDCAVSGAAHDSYGQSCKKWDN